MRVGIFSEARDLSGLPYDIQFRRVGENTGNLMFIRAIERLFSPKFISPSAAVEGRREEFADCDAFITTELIWIREGEPAGSVADTLAAIGDRPLIPISVGLQTERCRPDFRIEPSTLRLLCELSERCVIGTRGYYTAEILAKNGVKRVRPVGCPSLFYKSAYRPKRPRQVRRGVCGFSTLWRRLSAEEMRLLNYFMLNDMALVEQTGLYDLEPHREFDHWLTARRRIFFSTGEWDRFLDGFDFYMGMRFHGGVAAMQRGLPALFITSDSRTEELCDFFSLPALPLSRFDDTLPQGCYAEMGYPEDFIAAYPSHKENFREFARENRLKVRL